MASPERLKRTWKAIYLAYRANKDAFAFGQRFAESALAEREGGEAGRAVARMVVDLRKAGIASGDFKNLPPDLLGSLFMAPIAPGQADMVTPWMSFARPGAIAGLLDGERPDHAERRGCRGYGRAAPSGRHGHHRHRHRFCQRASGEVR